MTENTAECPQENQDARGPLDLTDSRVYRPSKVQKEVFEQKPDWRGPSCKNGVSRKSGLSSQKLTSGPKKFRITKRISEELSSKCFVALVCQAQDLVKLRVPVEGG